MGKSLSREKFDTILDEESINFIGKMLPFTTIFLIIFIFILFIPFLTIIIFLLPIIAILSFISKRIRKSIANFFKSPFIFSFKIALFISSLFSKNRMQIINKFIKDSLEMNNFSSNNKIKADIILGYKWIGKSFFGYFSKTGINFENLERGITIFGSYGLNIMRKIIKEAAMKENGIIIFDSSNIIGVPKNFTSTKVYNIGIDTLINPMDAKPLPLKIWTNILAMAISVACTLDIEEASLLADFFYNQYEYENILRVDQVNLWSDGLNRFFEKRRADILKADIKKLLLTKIFSDEGKNILNFLPKRGEIICLRVGGIDREQKTFLLILFIGVLHQVLKRKKEKILIVIDELQNLLPQIHLLPYDYRPVMERLMYMLKEASKNISLLLHTSATWIANYAYSITPNLIITAIEDPYIANEISKVFALGREGDNFILKLSPQESIVKVMTHEGMKTFLMLTPIIDFNIDIDKDMENVLEKEIGENVTTLKKDFLNKSEVAYNIMKLMFQLKNVNIATIQAYLSEKYELNDIRELIKELIDKKYLKISSDDEEKIEITEKGIIAINEWEERNFIKKKEDIKEEEIYLKINEKLVKKLIEIEKKFLHQEWCQSIILSYNLVRHVMILLISNPEKTRWKKFKALYETLCIEGLKPIEMEDIEWLEEIKNKAEKADLSIGEKEAERALKIAKNVLMSILRKGER
ncbi:MAG: hypothetical protein QW806_05905 [Nitrososphaerota archaeon]